MLSSKGHPGIFAHQPGAQHLNETEAIGDYTPGLPGAWHLSSQEHSLPEMDKFSMSLSNMQDPHFEAGKGAPLYEKRALSPDMDMVRARSPLTEDGRTRASSRGGAGSSRNGLGSWGGASGGSESPFGAEWKQPRTGQLNIL